MKSLQQPGMTVDRPAGARLLVVDDEPDVRDALVTGLSLDGYEARGAASARQALEMLDRSPFDLMVVDIRMPDMDGTQLMQAARQKDPDLLFLVLTGHATLESAIVAVKSGASDYLLKPVSLRELSAAAATALHAHSARLQRQRALNLMHEAMDLLRQSAAPPPGATAAAPSPLLQAGQLCLDRERRQAMIVPSPETAAGGAPDAAPRLQAEVIAELTESESAVLGALMGRAGEVLSCRALARAAWGYDLDEARAQALVRPCISRLRPKIQSARAPAIGIHTVRGKGYILSV